MLPVKNEEGYSTPEPKLDKSQSPELSKSPDTIVSIDQTTNQPLELQENTELEPSYLNNERASLLVNRMSRVHPKLEDSPTKQNNQMKIKFSPYRSKKPEPIVSNVQSELTQDISRILVSDHAVFEDNQYASSPQPKPNNYYEFEEVRKFSSTPTSHFSKNFYWQESPYSEGRKSAPIPEFNDN